MQIKVETEVGQTISRADLERLLRRSIFAGQRTVERVAYWEMTARARSRFELTDDPNVYRRVT